MKLTDELDLNELKKIYLFSNTPLYLYNNFKRNKSIQNLSETDTKTLINHFDKIIIKKPTLDNLVTLYALIMGLTFKDIHEVNGFFDKLDIYNIEWAKEIRNIYKAKNIPTQIYKVKARIIRPEIKIISESASSPMQIKDSKPIISIKE
ncbi:MAG: hypothetical protein ACLP2P_02770 [Desulfobaccales bacterium]